jgi:hypothetical protein
MRIDKLICSFALLALAGAANPNPATVDPNQDFDCAVLLKFFHRVMVPDGPADLQEETLIMNAWFTAKWAQDHPKEEANEREHYLAMVKAIGEDPKSQRDRLNACSARANADPRFGRFVSAFQSTIAKDRQPSPR